MTVAAPVLLKSLPDILGIPAATVTAAYRDLRQNDVIPKSVGATIAEMDAAHATLIVLGSIAPGPAHVSARLAVLYAKLRDHEGFRAGDAIANLICNPALESFAKNCFVTVDMESPRIVIAREDENEEATFGTRDMKADEERITKSVRIPGRVLLKIAALLK